MDESGQQVDGLRPGFERFLRCSSRMALQWFHNSADTTAGHGVNTIQSDYSLRLLLVFISLSLIALNACKKDANSATSNVKLLTAGRWTLQKSEQRQRDGSWVVQPKPNYETTMEFHDDKTVTIMVASRPAVKGWQLPENTSQLILINTGGGGKTYDIFQLTSSVLQFTPAGYDSTDWAHERYVYSISASSS